MVALAATVGTRNIRDRVGTAFVRNALLFGGLPPNYKTQPEPAMHTQLMNPYYVNGKLRRDARRRAVAEVSYGSPYLMGLVRREPGNTYCGQPIYWGKAGKQYACGRTKKVPGGATLVRETGIWVLLLPW